MSEFKKIYMVQPNAAISEEETLGVLAATGQWMIDRVRQFVQFFSIAAAILWQCCRPLTWRRTIRAEFMQQCHQVGTRALPFIMLTAIFVGLGTVYQTLYWLKVFGQSEFAGRLLVLVLVREIAPILVGLIVIGRSGSFIIAELGNMQAGGQVHGLDAQGIDPFLYLVVPRVMAVTICMFCLTIVFLVVALAAGFVADNVLSATDLPIYDFIQMLLMAMGPDEFVMVPLKTITIGFAVALIACITGLSKITSADDVAHLLPAGIVTCVLVMFLISSVLTLLF